MLISLWSCLALLQVSGRSCYRISLREQITAVNAIGAGDTVASGLLHHWTQCLTTVEDSPPSVRELMTVDRLATEMLAAFAWGLSCGTASCATDINSVFDMSLALKLYQSVEIMAC